jgi:hypothetical protein
MRTWANGLGINKNARSYAPAHEQAHALLFPFELAHRFTLTIGKLTFARLKRKRGD